MGAIAYRLWRRTRTRWVSAVSLAAVVAVVGGVVLVLAAGVLRTVSAPERYSDRQGDAYDASLEQSGGKPRTADVEALPSVARVEMASFVFGGLLQPDSDEPADALVFAGSHLAFGERLTDGREPDRSHPGEFLATRSWVEATGAALGDRFELVTISQALADERGFDVPGPDGPALTATFVGVLDGPTELQDPTPLVVFPASLLEVGDVGVSASIGLVSLEAGSTIDDLRAQLDALPGGEVFGLDAAEWVPSDVRSAVSAQAQGLAVVATIVAVASVAVVGQLLGRQARLPEAQRLALTSIGLTRAQLIADPLSAAAVPIVVGSIGAAAVAFGASGVFPLGFARRVEPSPGPLFEPLVHGLGPLLLAGLLLSWVLVALALGDREGGGDHLPGVAERLASRVRPGPAATGLRFAFTRHPRDPGSARAPLVGLVLVLGVLVGALTFGASAGRFIDEPARWGSNFDLGMGAGGDAIPDEVRATLEHDPDVAALAVFGTVLASAGAVTIDVTGMEPLVGDIPPDILEGRRPAADDEIILGRVAARDLGVGVGDDLVINGAAESVSFHVTGLAVIPGIEGGDGIGEGGVVTVDGLHRLDADATLGSAAIVLRPGAPEGVGARLSAETGMGVGLFDRPSAVRNLANVRSTPFVVALVLGALALLSIAQQLSVSTSRRRRDLAVLRALGADRRWVTSVLHWQATLLTLAVLSLATPWGVAAGRLVYQRYIDRIGARTDISVPFGLLAGTLVVVLLLANVAAALPARRARRERPARVFADE